MQELSWLLMYHSSMTAQNNAALRYMLVENHDRLGTKRGREQTAVARGEIPSKLPILFSDCLMFSYYSFVCLFVCFLIENIWNKEGTIHMRCCTMKPLK